MPRPNNAFMDALIDAPPTQVLDHGFVRLIDYMGDEAAIVQAARISYGTGTLTPSEDRGLIRYLMRHRHTTPFEMCEAKFHIKLPIFVARQLVRHRTANLNEYSARYSILDREFYVPSEDAIGAQSTSNKQGRSQEEVPFEYAKRVRDLIIHSADVGYDAYDTLLNDDGKGKVKDPALPMLARELARMNLTLNFYTQWYWKFDLHNLLHMLGLRLDPHAQLETRKVVEPIWRAVQGWMPVVAEAFEDYRLGALTLSQLDLKVLRYVIDTGEARSAASLSDLPRLMANDEYIVDIIPNKRERQEFFDKLKRLLPA